MLVRTIEDQSLGVCTGEQRHIHFLGTKTIASRTLLVHNMSNGEPVVRLIGKQDFNLGIMLPERIPERSVGVAQLIFRNDEQRRAEAVGQILDVTRVNEKIAVGTNADEFAEFDLVVDWIELWDMARHFVLNRHGALL